VGGRGATTQTFAPGGKYPRAAIVYFAIFAAFKELVDLNLAQRSFIVIDFDTNRQRVYIFLLVVNSNLDPILHRFREMAA